MNDLISREAAIRTVLKMYGDCDTYDIFDYRDLLLEAFKVLPSAQPNTKEHSQHVESVGCVGDTISRQAAIDAVCMEWCNVKHQDCKHPFNVEKDDYYWCDGCETVLRTLPDLPSAQPERQKGEWILADTQNEEDVQNDNYRYICSCCGYSDIHSKAVRVPYCWHCGADMRGEEK